MGNEELVKKMVKEVWNEHNLNVLKNFCDQNILVHGPHGEIKGFDKFNGFVKDVFTAFPDVQYTIQDIFSSGDKVVVRWVGKGTNKGNFIGNPPTNKKMTYEGITIYKCENNKIKEYWVSADLFGVLRQLGILHTHAH